MCETNTNHLINKMIKPSIKIYTTPNTKFGHSLDEWVKERIEWKRKREGEIRAKWNAQAFVQNSFMTFKAPNHLFNYVIYSLPYVIKRVALELHFYQDIIYRQWIFYFISFIVVCCILYFENEKKSFFLLFVYCVTTKAFMNFPIASLKINKTKST